MADPVNPFSEEDFQRMKQAMRELDRAEEGADKAEQAGIDVSTIRARIQQEKERLNRILSVYFPGR